jgi:hypothetical protein
MYKYILNNLIPADDLHWDTYEKKYVSLSDDETNEIVSACLKNGITELEDVTKVVNWCGSIRIGQILWKNFITGSVDICGFDDAGEPMFSIKKGNE